MSIYWCLLLQPKCLAYPEPSSLVSTSVVQPSAFHETLVHVLFCPPAFPLLRMPTAPGTWPSFRHGCLIPSFDIWCVSLVLPLFCILFVPPCLLSWDSLFPKSQAPLPPSINSPWNSVSLLKKTEQIKERLLLRILAETCSYEKRGTTPSYPLSLDPSPSHTAHHLSVSEM